MPTLAEAYVQIIPSAKGIKEKIGKELGDSGNSTGSSWGKNFTGTVKKLIAAAGIGAAVKSALTEGAALEQSIGGVETLFKDSADTVKKYADEAYKTAGLSANAYMETITGFSASLLQGLGGDTAKAAEIGNMAVIDMSDNANKMGSNMQDIQNAYQGFAKQNYTMLDNLKLGYGGTKTEMQRLLKDAEKVSGVHYDISNLSDVYSAIHVIQGELDITGTTSKEAATTFSGSLAAMKAAGKNVLGNLALGKDIAPSLNELQQSVYTFVVGNMIPMVANVLKSLPQVLTGAGSMIIQALNVASNNTDEIIQLGVDIVSELIIGIVQTAPYIAEGALKLFAALANSLITMDWTETANNLITGLRNSIDVFGAEVLGSDENIVGSILNAITEKLPDVLQKGVEIVSVIVNGILSNLPQLIMSAGTLLSRFVGFFMSNMPTILQTGIKLLLELVQGIINSLPSVATAATKVIIQLVQTIADHLPDLLQSGIELIGELIAGIIQKIPDAAESAAKTVTGIVNEFKNFEWKSLGKNIVDGIAKGITSAAGAIADAAKKAAKKALDAAKDFLGIKSPSRVMRDQVGKWIPAGIADGITKYSSPISDAMKSLTDQTTGTLQTNLEVGIVKSGRSMNGTLAAGVETQNSGYTQNISIYSPTQLSPSEVARQTRNATRGMVLAMRGV